MTPYAVQMVSAFNLICYLISGRAQFSVTGQCSENTKFSQGNSFFDQSLANHPFAKGIELAAAIILLGLTVLTQNIWLLAFSAGLFISAVLLKYGDEHPAARYGYAAPFVLVLVVIAVIIRNLIR